LKVLAAPSLGRVAAALAVGDDFPDDLVNHGVTADDLSPHRFAGSGSG
jgi:hypothetical protein